MARRLPIAAATDIKSVCPAPPYRAALDLRGDLCRNHERDGIETKKSTEANTMTGACQLRLIDQIKTEVTVVEKSVHDFLVGVIRATAPHHDIDIIPISETRESRLGWDAAIDDGVVPLFLQYKLPSFTTRARYDWPAQNIARQDRGFDDDEGVFHFPLRKQSHSAPISQHQLLLNLQRAGEHAYYTSTVYKDFTNLWKTGAGFGPPGSGSWKAWHTISLLRGAPVRRYFVPWVSGLIFIPPHDEVPDPPEDHRIFYNGFYEASLHSDAQFMRSYDFRDLLTLVGRQLERADVISGNGMNGEYVARLFDALVGDVERRGEWVRSLLDQYAFERQSGTMRDGDTAKGRWKALHRVLWNTFGMDLVLAGKRFPESA